MQWLLTPMCGVIISTTAQALTCGSVNPLGAKGIGELALVGVAPAIANAVFTQPASACVTFPLPRRNCCDQSTFERVQVGLHREPRPNVAGMRSKRGKDKARRRR
jgi:hypothetical protein